MTDDSTTKATHTPSPIRRDLQSDAVSALCDTLNGPYHYTAERRDYDRRRRRVLEARGLTVLEFDNHRVFDDLAAVLAAIEGCLERS